MNSFRLAWAAMLAVTLTGAASASAEPPFQLSSKFHEARFVRGNAWDGTHRFGNVFCLTFPHSADVETLAQAMYNRNTLYLSRAAYKDMTALHVVTSVVPAGRSVEAEIGNLAAQNQKLVDAYPDYFTQGRTPGLLGPSLVLTVRNATQGSKDAPFPFIRSVRADPDGQLASLSVHRLFVHRRDRIEVAGLRYFETPIGSEGEAEAISNLTALVETAAESLQACTAGLPPRER